MKSVLFLIAFSLVTVVRGNMHGHGPRHSLEPRTVGGYYQKPKGIATFTAYDGCQHPACGIVGYGYTAALSQRSFGAAGNEGSGGACGRCFNITGTEDMYSPQFKGPYKSTIVKITDLCPFQEGEDWCGQCNSTPLNQYDAPVHFDLCDDSGAPDAFFPEGRHALLGHYEEVSCCKWNGWNGEPLWNDACLDGESASFWPAQGGCPNKGTAP